MIKEIKSYWDKEEKILKEKYSLKDGKYHGLCQTWYENGQKNVECSYVDDKYHGLHQYWYRNGQKKEESWYDNGIEYKSQEEYEEASITTSITNKGW